VVSSSPFVDLNTNVWVFTKSGVNFSSYLNLSRRRVGFIPLLDLSASFQLVC
jgi:hypothetical protein